MSTDTADELQELSAEALAFINDPALRMEGAPFLHRVRAVAPVLRTDAGVWLVTRHADALAILKDGERWSRRAFTEQHAGTIDPQVLEYHLSGRPTMSDGAAHRRLRNLAAPAFTPAAVKRWRTTMEEIATNLLDELEPKGAMDATRELGYPFSQQLASFLLGVPYEDHVLWESWQERMLPLLVGIESEEGVRQATEATYEFAEYVAALASRLREHPTDGLFSLMVNAEEDGSRLSEVELVGFAHEILGASFDSTANTVETVMWMLLRHPDQLAKLREDPSLWPAAIEEVLRYVSIGTMLLPRMAASDVELGGVTIPKGEVAIVYVDGPNRDPEVFEDPDRFDICRESKQHLSFGFGTHFCLGAGLARMGLGILLPMVFDRLPNLRLVEEKPPWNLSQTHFRFLERLDVVW